MKTTKKILGVALAVIMLCNVFAVFDCFHYGLDNDFADNECEYCCNYFTCNRGS